jgi:hypothetical protein
LLLHSVNICKTLKIIVKLILFLFLKKIPQEISQKVNVRFYRVYNNLINSIINFQILITIKILILDSSLLQPSPSRLILDCLQSSLIAYKKWTNVVGGKRLGNCLKLVGLIVEISIETTNRPASRIFGSWVRFEIRNFKIEDSQNKTKFKM